MRIIRRGKKKKEIRLASWAFLPLLLWHFLTLCAAGPLACVPFYASGQESIDISSYGSHDTMASPHSYARKAPHRGTSSYCHLKGETEETLPRYSHEEEVCCDSAGKQAIFRPPSSQIENPLAREKILAVDSLVFVPRPERLCLGTLLRSTHALPIYLLDSALLI